jgi:hypothetical protein
LKIALSDEYQNTCNPRPVLTIPFTLSTASNESSLGELPVHTHVSLQRSHGFRFFPTMLHLKRVRDYGDQTLNEVASLDRQCTPISDFHGSIQFPLSFECWCSPEKSARLEWESSCGTHLPSAGLEISNRPTTLKSSARTLYGMDSSRCPQRSGT